MRSESKRVTFTQAARRAQIVTAAIEVIAEIGWTQTSIRKVADRVGVAMSAVLYHFGSKDNLVDAIIEEMYRSAISALVPALEAEDTSAAKLATYIRATIDYYDGHRTQLAALAQLSAAYQPSDGRRFEELGMSDELREELAALEPAAILAAGQRDREFGEFSVGSMATALRGAVNAAVEKILRAPDFDARAYAEDLVTIFARAVAEQR